MLALRAGSRRLAACQATTAPSSSAPKLLQRALLSTGAPRPPTSTQPPRPSSAGVGATAGGPGKPAAATGTPPPSGAGAGAGAAKGAAAPPPSEGLGLGTALGMVLLAGGTAVTGYYYVLADEKEKAQIEGYVAQAKALVGLGGEEAPKPKAAAKAVEEKAKEGKHKVGTFLHEVREGAVHAKEEVKGQLKRAVTQARNVAHAVEEKVEHAVEAVIHPHKEEAAAKGEEVKAKAEAAGAGAGAVIKEKVQQAKAAAAHAVEEAEHLAEEIMQDIKEAVTPAKEEVAAAAAAPVAAAAAVVEEKKPSVGQQQTEAALKHFATYEARAKDVRFETLTRAAEEALAQGEALRKHLEATLLKDLAALGPDALRQRVVQLAGELQERTKWEALRLHEAVRKAEVEVSGKYVELIDKLREESTEELGRQARAFEAEKSLALQELKEAGERELKARLDKEMAAFTERLKQAYEEARAKDKAEVEAHAQRETENAVYENQSKFQAAVSGRLEELERLKAEVQALDQVFQTDTDYEHASYKVHRVSAAIMAFELGLLSSNPLKRELAALKHVTQGDAVLEPLLASLPSSVEQGVPTLSELQVRFPTVQSAAREAAFVPESSQGMAGHMFATAVAAVTIKPRGLVEGSGADEVLARAAYHVERGDLPKAVTELDTLQGLPGKVVKDWLQDAKGRLMVEQAVRAMSARSALLNSSLI